MRLVVKDWFHENKMKELKKDVQSTNVYAILKETEKAYNVLVGDTRECMTYWVSKSCVIEVSEIDKYGMSHKECLENVTFEEAFEDWKAEMDFYR